MKLGLVLEGGASRTLFSCGVMDALLLENIKTDYIIGTSAGIAYGATYASGQIGRNRTVSVKYMHSKKYMGLFHMLDPKNRSYYNLDFVFDTIPNKKVPFDYEAMERFGKDIYATVTNVKTGKAEYMRVSPKDKKNTVLRASCALPVMFKFIKIGGNKYLDGGICDPIPYRRALFDGCDKIIVILTREIGYKKGYDKATPIVDKLYRRYPEFLESFHHRPMVYNDSLSELERLEKEGKALIIRPDNVGGIKRTEKHPETLDMLYNQGLEIGKRRMKEIKAFCGRI